jgi:hypothetical protein
MQRITHLLNYCATNPDAVIRFKKSDMVLHVESDASYLSLPKATSRVAGYHYLSSAPTNPGKAPRREEEMPPMNGAINVVCNILRVVYQAQPKPKWPDYSTMQRKRAHYASRWPKWDTNNCPRQL